MNNNEEDLLKMGFANGFIKGRISYKKDIIIMLEKEFEKQNNPNSKFEDSIVLKRDFLEQINQLN